MSGVAIPSRPRLCVDDRAMMISMAPWQKVQAYIDAFGETHPDFAAAFANVQRALKGDPYVEPETPYVDPPI